MKKFSFKKLDKTYVKISLYIFVVAAALILFEKVVGHLPSIGGSLHTVFHYVKTLGAPFFLGFAFAYVMNPFMRFFEEKLKQCSPKFSEKPRATRTLCILANYFIIIGGSVWIIIYLLPEVKTSIITFASMLPTYSEELNERIAVMFNQIDFINSIDVQNAINHVLKPVVDASKDVPSLLETIIGNIYFFGRATLNFVMAVFIAFYMLLDKENFSHQAHKIVYALTTEEKADHIFRVSDRINHIFQEFIIGKAVDSLIIGILAFVGLSILKAPFPQILSLIIGVTNMIPYFGPFIGAIPAVIITLLIAPLKSVAVMIFILILQQFDGNYLGPKILGNSLDLSPLWIILAVVVGGATLGPLGMFIGVPIFATFKTFSSEFIGRRYDEKYPEDGPLSRRQKQLSEEKASEPSEE